MSDSAQVEALFQAVGTRVRELRLKSGLNQPELAAAAGVSAQYLWRIEDGRQNLSLRTMSRLAIALGVPMSALLEGIDASRQSLAKRPYRRGSAGDESSPE